MSSLVSVRDLCVDAELGEERRRILHDVSFEVAQGEIFGIVGESGSGKTMSALSLLGLLPVGVSVSSGNITFEGQELLPYDERVMHTIRGREIGYIFQEPSPSFDPLQSIGSSLFETLRVSAPKAEKAQLLDESIRLLEELQISRARERLRNYPHQFSGGMLQRVMIALAIAQHPRLLIADEPTTALDVTIQMEVLRLLLSLQESHRLTMIFISHNIVLISGIADRIAVMKEGRIVECAARKDIIHRPRHEYTKLLVENTLAVEDVRGA